MGNLTDPEFQTTRAGAREALARIGATPPSTPRPFDDNVDATHPLYVDFPLPNGVQVNFATLSFKFRLYRTYSTFTLASTGTDATAESGHSHSHGHTLHVLGTSGGIANNAAWQGSGLGVGDTSSAVAYDTNQVANVNAAGSSGHSHSHSHSISGSSTLGVSESGTTTSITAIAVDGVDVTASLGGGPWASDVVDLNITSLMPLGDGKWHTITLTVSGLGRIVGELRTG